MKYLSVCSGIEAATVAWHHLGWTPTAFAEIEPFPAAVLKHHYPHVVNHGDMTKFTEWPNESIDILVGGTPCQSFSIAGLRQGLKDPRGNLMLTYLAIAERYRPKWLVWENVPGVLSSGGGRDFGTFVGALGELGYGWAYRILDAQWFGVAQRRRRVFVVANFGNTISAAKVLFERESVCRNTSPSRNTGQGVATNFKTSVDVSPTITQCKGSRGGSSDKALTEITAVYKAFKKNEQIVYHAPITGTLAAVDGPKGVSDQYAHEGKLIATVCRSSEQANAENLIEVSSTLSCLHESPIVTTAYEQTMSAIPIHDQATRHTGKRGNKTDGKGNGLGVGKPYDPAPTLTKGDKHAVAQITSFHPTQDPISNNNINHALGTGSKNGCATTAIAIAYKPQNFGNNGGGYVEAKITNVVDSSQETKHRHVIMQSTAVRRLTPTECERLQGFPDGYTAISWKKKPASKCPDSPRYKALGNSMAVPVMRWIGERIDKIEKGAAL